ncbi:ParA family protein [Thioalkalivibrio sp. AKL19]|uniref:ParA family protein n=1 Tax=Thioalkalivibrio sp. AKL19 TaxID=1266914 RepID=UPI0018CA7A53|nr:AAA family ATPase [Thioalkalivibrio sp. AKL19]
MAKKIAFFNHKGGVSKTTNVFHFGWMLAEQGYKVLLVDADPQCNLTGLILSSGSFDRFEQHYLDRPDCNLKSALSPVFDGALSPLTAAPNLEIESRDGLYLLPGHLALSEYEITLTLAHELSGSVHALKNVPGAAAHLLDITADAVGADYVLIDLNPSLSSINQNLFLSSDGFIIPNSPDYFSQMAIHSLARVLPMWSSWLDRAVGHPALQDASYTLSARKPKFLGTVVQNFRLRGGDPTKGFQDQINRLFRVIDETLMPALSQSELAFSLERYSEVLGERSSGFCLGLVPDFNSLVTTSHIGSTPVFALSDEQIGSVGSVLSQNREKRGDFHDIYEKAVRQVVELLG